jgi:hypothetical protein
MSNKERAELLRSAASALEHGRHSTANKKIRQFLGEPQSILIAVDGGVATVIDRTVPAGFEIEIIDYDNLKEAPEETIINLSAAARKFVADDESVDDFTRNLAQQKLSAAKPQEAAMAARKSVRVILIAEFQDCRSEEDARRKLDAFRDAVQPGREYGITFYVPTPEEVEEL